MESKYKIVVNENNEPISKEDAVENLNEQLEKNN